MKHYYCQGVFRGPCAWPSPLKVTVFIFVLIFNVKKIMLNFEHFRKYTPKCTPGHPPFRFLQCESKKSPPPGDLAIFPKRLGMFPRDFTHLLCIPIYARLQIFIQLSAALMKLCHIKHDYLFHIMCARCPPSTETHAGIFWLFPQTIRNF